MLGSWFLGLDDPPKRLDETFVVPQNACQDEDHQGRNHIWFEGVACVSAMKHVATVLQTDPTTEEVLLLS